jgi:bisphosphoglycerate-independent phosphoglycerate mutase (AlkP superfamily)
MRRKTKMFFCLFIFTIFNLSFFNLINSVLPTKFHFKSSHTGISRRIKDILPLQLFLQNIERDYQRQLGVFGKEDKVGDQNVQPIVLTDAKGVPVGRIKDGEAVDFFNYREDRMVQKLHAILGVMYEKLKEFLGKGDQNKAKYEEFIKKIKGILPNFGSLLSMVNYADDFHNPVVMPPISVPLPFSEYLSQQKLTQLRVAESEKRHHVTHFFNGAIDKPFEGEEIEIIQSFPQEVDLAEHWQMKAAEITDKALEKIKAKNYDFVLVNYANADMVGHTGSMEAAVKAVEFTDTQLGRLVEGARKEGYTVVITSDHGNAEKMFEVKDGKKTALTEHTTNQVPFIVVGDEHLKKVKLRPDGVLGDIIPTAYRLTGRDPQNYIEKIEEQIRTGKDHPETVPGKVILENPGAVPLGQNKGKVMVIVLDGWGYREEKEGNAIAQANKPNFDRYWNEYPHTLVKAAEGSVGLPEGTMGNSEVGHMNIGTARIVPQQLKRINRAIEDGGFYKNEEQLKAFRYAKEHNVPYHLIGMVSDGGVHSHVEHLKAKLRMAKEMGVKVYIHVLLDGRDTPPRSAAKYLTQSQNFIQEIGVDAQIVDVIGRAIGMDRDNNWVLEWKTWQTWIRGAVEGESGFVTYVRGP